MTIFFSSSPYNLGSATCIVGCGTVFGENQKFYEMMSDKGAKITEPTGDILRSKIVPRVFVPWGEKHLFTKGVGGIELPPEYMPVLFRMMKKAYYMEGDTTKEGRKKLDANIKWAINKLLSDQRLLRSEDLEGRPQRELEEIQILHDSMENLSRGRRSYLNFSADQPEWALKKDREFRQAFRKSKPEKEITPYDPEPVKLKPVLDIPSEEVPVIDPSKWRRS